MPILHVEYPDSRDEMRLLHGGSAEGGVRGANKALRHRGAEGEDAARPERAGGLKPALHVECKKPRAIALGFFILNVGWAYSPPKLSGCAASPPQCLFQLTSPPDQ